MIRIHKPKDPPHVLATKGVAARDAHCAAYDAGEREFSFRADIYGASKVKEVLATAQYGKCCFCERKVGRGGDVEHFRPKSGSKQSAGAGEMLRPGYYWLAYEWDNLLLSCSDCNTRYKGNLFPLTKPQARARCHHDDLDREEPLLIHPAHDNPSRYIGFREEYPFAINDDVRGKATIAALGLDHEKMNEVRRSRLHEIRRLQGILRLAQDQSGNAKVQQVAQEAQGALIEMLSDSGEFAAMARAAVR